MSIQLPLLPEDPTARLALLKTGLHQLWDRLNLAGKTDTEIARTAENIRVICDLEKDLEEPRMTDLLWFLQNLKPELLPMQALPLEVRITRQTLRVWAEQAVDPVYAFNYNLALCLTLAAHEPKLPLWYLHSLVNTGKDRWLLTVLALFEHVVPIEQ